MVRPGVSTRVQSLRCVDRDGRICSRKKYLPTPVFSTMRSSWRALTAARTCRSLAAPSRVPYT